MVVGHEDVDAALTGGGDLRGARRAGVDGDDHGGAGGMGGLDRRHREAVAFIEPRGHIRYDRGAERPEREGQDREPGDPVGIEIAEHEDPLPGIPSTLHPRPEGAGVRQHPGIVEALDGRTEVPRERFPVEDAARRHEARRPGTEAEIRRRRQQLRTRGDSGGKDPAGPRLEHDVRMPRAAAPRLRRPRWCCGGPWAGCRPGRAGDPPTPARPRGAGWR